MPKVNNELGITPTTIAIKAITDAGYPLEKAYEIVKGDPPKKRQMYAMQKRLDELSMVEPARVSEAINALDCILAGEKIGQVKTVSTSDILQACRMILDRHEPVVSVNQNLNVSVELSPVDLDKYRNQSDQD